MDLTDIERALHPKAAEQTLFLSMHGTFPMDRSQAIPKNKTW